MSVNDGGSAFPCIKAWKADSNGQASNTGYQVKDSTPGMSLRDYFAGQALAGLSSAIGFDGTWSTSPGYTALMAYDYADAMLAERAKRMEQQP